MSFFTNFLEGFKSTAPVSTNPPPCTSDNVISSQTVEEDWQIVNPHEAGVIYHDRITLLLGYRQEIRHQIFLTNMPKSSKLLNHFKALDPSRRIMTLSFLDIPMVKSYLNSHVLSADALAIELSWLDIIKLAATARMFQDAHVEDKALAALKAKAIIALSPGNAVSLFKTADFIFAETYHLETYDGEKLLETLHDIRTMDKYNPELPKVELSKAQDKKPKSKEVKQRAPGMKYRNSMLKGTGLVVVKKEDDDKVHPARPPTVPPSASALKHRDAKNFIWPDE